MLPALFVVAFVAMVALVASGRSRKARAQSRRRAEVLRAAAPVIAGSVSDDLKLTGTYRGYPVEVSLATTDPSPVGTSRYSVEVIRLRLAGAAGGHPWQCRVGVHLLGGTRFEFVRPEGELGPFVGALTRLGGMPAPDPGLEDRLRAAGVIDALQRLGQPSKSWLPNVRFTPDMGPAMVGRLRGAGINVPETALERVQHGPGGLELELERTDGYDPSPERFRELLETAVGIADINARVNPA